MPKFYLTSVFMLLLPCVSWACSPPFVGFYDPLENTVRVPQQEEIPKPSLSSLELIRGTGSAGFSCDDAGQLNFVVSLPPGSPRKIDDFGLSMTLVDGKDPYSIASEEPLMLWREEDGTARIYLWWLDGAPDEQYPLHLRIDLRLVSGDAVGPPARIRIVSP